jgi:chromosome segregation protein
MSMQLRENLRQKDVEEKHSDWNYEYQRLNKNIQSSRKQIEELKQRRIKSEEELKKIINRPEEIAQKRGQLIETKGFAEKERQFAADRLAEADNELKKYENVLRKAQNDLANVRESKGRTEATKELAESRLSELESESLEKYNCRPESIISKLSISDDLETLQNNFERNETKLEKLKQQRDTLGIVNLRADLETKEIEQELEKMNSEKTDLETAIKKMRESIEELNKEGRARLLEAFDIVNNHFKEVFIKLFNGGKAHLELVDADDPLEAGLEMMVSPPGKKLQSMSLLSGGEQALTAMSLIFAVFLTNPAPICVLDEVDAPLDDANVERFCNLLDDIAEKTNTKFLIITHHALTMSRMDRLFGVTMAERGVSQIVSVDLKKAEEIGAVA